MRLHSITENDEYGGLEDADEFGELGICQRCDRGIRSGPDWPLAWDCDRCDCKAHFSCAMPSRQDCRDYDTKREWILSSGWYYHRRHVLHISTYCPHCARTQRPVWEARGLPIDRLELPNPPLE